MVFERLVVGELESNCYVLKSVGIGIIIDPGAEPDRIMSAASGVEIQLILATHRHYDHVDALIEVKKATGAQAAIHFLDWLHGFDLRLQDGQIIKFGHEQITVLHTPGHTPGGCCFLIGADLFSGDTLFPGGHGNVSFRGGDQQAILKSIKEKLLVLPDKTKVHPGHGPATTIGQERSLYQ
ncbi:MAG: MBL fold metallo-hydrolase [bacterium]